MNNNPVAKHFSFKNILCETGEVAPDYASYLLTNHWRKFRLHIYELKQHKCNKCHKVISEFHVHHLTYKRIGFERDSDVKLLCYTCHKNVHVKKDKIKKKKNASKEREIKKILQDKDNPRYYSGKYRDKKNDKIIYPVVIVK